MPITSYGIIGSKTGVTLIGAASASKLKAITLLTVSSVELTMIQPIAISEIARTTRGILCPPSATRTVI